MSDKEMENAGKANYKTAALPSYTENETMPGPIKMTTKRILIVVVTIVILVAMVTGAALLGVYMQHQHVQNLVQEVTIDTKDGKERIRVDPEKGQEEYELPDEKFSVLHDFNKGITVYRAVLTDSAACYLQPLNQTGRLPPRALASYLKKGGVLDAREPEETENGPYPLVVSKNKVKDRSFLCDRARQMCYKLPVYWLLPAGQFPLRKAGREKRAQYCFDKCWTITIFWRKRRICISLCCC